MTVPSNLSSIRTKVRRIIAQNSSVQISDTEIDNYINTFYVYDLPMHLPLFNMKETYTFYTTPNVDTYEFPRNLFSFVNPPAYCAGYQMFYSQSREQFFRTYPKFNFFDSIGMGDGTTLTFTLQATQTPFLGAYVNENNEITSDFILSSTDTSGNAIQVIANGVYSAPNTMPLINFVGSVALPASTVNFVSGVIQVTFLTPPAVAQPIVAQYVPYVAARPLAMLFFQDQFFVRPVPDNVYQVQIDAWKLPIQFTGTNPAAQPQLNEWWQLIAYGAADKFFADQADFENLQKFRFLMMEQLKLINRRTIKQQTNQRSSTIYSEQIQFPYNNNFYRF